MTQRGIVCCLFGCLVVLGLYGAATADHMTGRYTLTSQDEQSPNLRGSTLQIQQSGRNLMGQVAGPHVQAQLRGETDGQNNARGTLTLPDGRWWFFESQWNTSGMLLAIINVDSQGRPDHSSPPRALFFTPEAAGGQPGLPQGQPGSPSPSPPPQGGPVPPQGGLPPPQGGPAPLGSAPAGAPRTITLQRLVVTDPDLDNMPAFSLYVPAHWQGGGRIVREDQPLTRLAWMQATVAVTDPTGVEGFFTMPTEGFFWNPDYIRVGKQSGHVETGQELQPPMDLQQYVHNILLPRYRTEIRHPKLVGVEVFKRMGEAVERRNAIPGETIHASVGRVRLSHYVGEVEVEEDFYLTLLYSRVGWGPQESFSCRSRKGELDVNTRMLFGFIAKSIRVELAWANIIQQTGSIVYQIFKNRQEHATRRTTIISQTTHIISDERRAIWEANQKSRDAHMEAFVETIKGVETRYDPQTGKRHEVPSGYDNVWIRRGSTEQIVISTNAGYNPNRGSTVQWDQLRPGG